MHAERGWPVVTLVQLDHQRTGGQRTRREAGRHIERHRLRCVAQVQCPPQGLPAAVGVVHGRLRVAPQLAGKGQPDQVQRQRTEVGGGADDPPPVDAEMAAGDGSQARARDVAGGDPLIEDPGEGAQGLGDVLGQGRVGRAGRRRLELELLHGRG